MGGAFEGVPGVVRLGKMVHEYFEKKKEENNTEK